METRHLIDGIVRQTTVLIAQLATAAGVRAPLAHIADQVFIDLSREIEAQGVGRKIVADMFGLALRTYQKKVRRLTESVTVREQTLWEAVLGFVGERASVSRAEVVEHFAADGELEVAAVLNDLVGEGLVYSTGRGSDAVYGKTSALEQAAVSRGRSVDVVAHMLWHRIYRLGPLTRPQLDAQITDDPSIVHEALARLTADGRVTVTERDGAEVLEASSFVVPVGSEQGWEAAVFDHFSAMARAIATKIRRGRPESEHADEIGGATLTFEIHAGHPLATEVRGLLRRVRSDVDDLWQRVESHNELHPIPEADRVRACFYFGQSIEDASEQDMIEGS